MAKQTRRKYWKRKGRWSSNIRTIQNTAVNAPPGSFYTYSDLCNNPSQNTSTVSQKYTVKNIELTFEIDFQTVQTVGAAIEALIAYIMFVPQGYTITETLPSYHPEWIMAYRFLGSPSNEIDSTGGYIGPGRNPLKIKTRLARRLNTGDKIVLLITGYNSSQIATSVDFNGIVRWWTKAN